MNGATPGVVFPTRFPSPSTTAPFESNRTTPKISVPETWPPMRLPLTSTAALSIEMIGNLSSKINCGSITTLVMLPLMVSPSPPMSPTAADSWIRKRSGFVLKWGHCRDTDRLESGTKLGMPSFVASLIVTETPKPSFATNEPSPWMANLLAEPTMSTAPTTRWAAMLPKLIKSWSAPASGRTVTVVAERVR